MRFVYTIMLALLAAAVVAVVAVFTAPPAVVSWGVLAAYVVWPAVWLVVKPILTTPLDVLFPVPQGKVFPNPELLGVHHTGSRLQTVKRHATRGLAAFVEIGLWPAAGLTGRTLHTVGTGSARVRYPHLETYAVMSALCAVALIGLRTQVETGAAVTVAGLGLLATITARHALWIVSGEDFRLLLRRSLPEPYVALVFLTVFDYVALVALAVVLQWHAGDSMSVERVITAGRDLLELRHLTKLPHAHVTPIVVCLAVAVAAYWTSLASQLLRFTSFRRSYDDRAWLAALTLEEGHLQDATKLLEPVPGDYVSGPILQMRIRLAVARSDLDTALSLARALDHQLDPKHASADGAFVHLAREMSRAHVERGAAWSVIEQACAAHISDGAMFATLRRLGWTGIARVNDWEARAGASGLTPERYALGWSWFVGSTGSLGKVPQALEHARPASETDAMVRSIALQAAAVQSHVRFSADEIAQQLARVLQALSGSSVDGLPAWLREFLVTCTWQLEQRARDR